MDWDEAQSKAGQGAVLGEVLERLSVGELRARIGELQREIVRVEAEIKKRDAHQSQADQVFKS